MQISFIINKILLIIICLIFSTFAGSGQKIKPNILFILTDDLGINDLGCYGRKEHRTPNIDRLASQGIKFTASYCALPICSPSRAAILTGKNPAKLHLTTFLPGRKDCPSQKVLHPVINQQLPLEEITLAEYLKKAGYATACLGKWHLGGKGFGPLQQGFDFYYPGKADTKPSDNEGGKGEYDLTMTAIKFIETNINKPFFVYLAHNTPHIPYSAKQSLIEKNKDTFEPVYAALIETLDDTIGILMRKLDEFGLSTNTIVIFSSDNGGLHVPELSHKIITHNSPYRAGKGFLYEGGLRVPLIVKWDGKIPSGKTIDTPVINNDLLPTLLELIGEKVPENIDGKSFASILKKGGNTKSKRRFYFHFPHYTNQGGRPAGAIIEGDWKLIKYYDDDSIELYNLKHDIGETTNLALKEKQIAKKMEKQLLDWILSEKLQTNAPNPDFNPLLYNKLYVDVDPSKYDPAHATPDVLQKMIEWRKLMDQVVK